MPKDDALYAEKTAVNQNTDTQRHHRQQLQRQS
jgi:hypothetical protein